MCVWKDARRSETASSRAGNQALTNLQHSRKRIGNRASFRTHGALIRPMERLDMIRSHSSSALSCIALIASTLIGLPVTAAAESEDSLFFRDVTGTWQGPGKIVEGKMKGTSFKCTLDGLPMDAPASGFRLDGTCRSGLLSQRVTAEFIQDGDGYRGQFLDGADGDGLDVTGGNINGRVAVLDVQRDDVKGAVVTNLMSDDDLNITIMIRGATQFIPVIGLSLKRQTDSMAVGAIR